MERWNPDISAIHLLRCPTCAGFGFERTTGGIHKRCDHCSHGDAVLGVMEDKVLFFSAHINRVSVSGRRIAEFLNRLLDLAAILLALFSIAYGIWGTIQLHLGFDIVRVVNQPHTPVAWVWFGFFLCLFIMYRVTHASERLRILPPQAVLVDHVNTLSGVTQWSAARAIAGKLNVAQHMQEEALRTVENAVHLAHTFGHTTVLPAHVFVAALRTSSVQVVLGRLGIPLAPLVSKIGTALKHVQQPGPKHLSPELDAQTRTALVLAGFFARHDHRLRIETTQLMQATLAVDQLLQDVLTDLDIDLHGVFNTIEWIHIQANLRDRHSHWRSTRLAKPKGIMNRAMTARPTPTLDSMAQDYTQAARAGAFYPLIGREKELLEAFRVLKEGNGNVLLVGEPGAGKSTLLEGIAQLMTSEDVPKNLQDKRFVVLDPGALVAGAAGLGSLEGRMQTMAREIGKAGNVLLGIEDIHHLLGASSVGGSEDVGHVFMNYLSQGVLHVVATTTVSEFQKYILPQETFARRFQIVKVPELSPADALRVLMGKTGSIEYKAKSYFSYAALQACVDLSVHYIPDRYLPAKALDVMEEAAFYATEQRGEKSIITHEDVAAVISEKTNVPVTNVTASEAQKLLHLESILHKRIVGQDDAINAIASALRRAREELRDPGRPIASFLFLGPTGVGKTETAKALAEVYFGKEDQMIREDMSEYQDQFSIHKLIGDAGQQGQLTEAVRAKPFCVLLFDEVEKAHPNVLNVLLQLLDDGRLTEGTGKTIDFTNTIVIATSNAASVQIREGLSGGKTIEVLKRELLERDLLQTFKPELLNRFDHITLFTPLGFNDSIEVTRRLMRKVADQLTTKGITLESTDAAIQDLATRGYDPEFGARPLRRLIQDTVDDSLAKLLLESKLGRRDVVILDTGGQMTVRKAEQL